MTEYDFLPEEPTIRTALEWALRYEYAGQHLIVALGTDLVRGDQDVINERWADAVWQAYSLWRINQLRNETPTAIEDEGD